MWVQVTAKQMLRHCPTVSPQPLPYSHCLYSHRLTAIVSQPLPSQPSPHSRMVVFQGGTYAEPLMSDEQPGSWMFYEADLHTDR